MGLSQNLNYQVQIVQTLSDTGETLRVIAPLASEQFMMDLSAQFSAPWSGGLLTDPKLTTITSAAFGIVPIVQGMTAQVWAGATETELGIDLSLQAEFDAELEVRNVIKTLFRFVTPSVGSLGFLTSPGPKIDWKKVGGQILSSAQKAGIDTSALGFAAEPTDTSPGTQKKGDMVDTNQSLSDGSQTSVQSENPSDDESLGTGNNPLSGYVKDKISLRIGKNLFFDNVVLTNVQVTEENQFDARGFPMYARVSLRFKPLFIIVQSDLDNIFGGPPPEEEAPALGETPTEGADVEVNPVYLPPDPVPVELPPPGPVAEASPVWEPAPTQRFPVN